MSSIHIELLPLDLPMDFEGFNQLRWLLFIGHHWSANKVCILIPHFHLTCDPDLVFELAVAVRFLATVAVET
jgi:hypothetical protein